MTDVDHARALDAARFILSRFNAKIGRTLLMKMLYLADLQAHRFLGRSITGIPYRWYHNGPFDETLYKVVERLKDAQELVEDRYQSSYGPMASSFKYVGVPPATCLGEAEDCILSSVLVDYCGTDLAKLLDDVIYKTKPMELAKAANAKNQPLNMSAVNFEGRDEFGGIELEEVLRGEADARAGRGKTLEEVGVELRSQGQRDRNSETDCPR